MPTSKIRSSIQAQVMTRLEALSHVTDPQSRRFAEMLKEGNLSVERFFAYEAVWQQPHSRDVAYMIVQGSGVFICGNKRTSFELGDFLFTPAGMYHRFEQLSEDIVIWVISYGDGALAS
jgi:mannose-6-phosphate isomerase-like protein (cupin superfamily)